MNPTPSIVLINSMALTYFSLGMFMQVFMRRTSKFWTYLAWCTLVMSLVILCIPLGVARAIPTWLMMASLIGTLNIYLGNQLPQLHPKLTTIAGILSVMGLASLAGSYWL